MADDRASPERVRGYDAVMDTFPRTVFGLDRAPAGQTITPEMTARYSRALARYDLNAQT